jgi:REP element-mobilizing transposase RayT
MPEHIHLVIYPRINTKIGLVIGELKSNSAYYALDYIKKAGDTYYEKLKVIRDGRQKLSFWQRRCYDHNCRSIKTVKEKITYCHKNPVIRGLVSESSEWKWSSYNWYNGEKNVPIPMDVLEV